ncbi:hypothetical protein Glove_350g174 [Diversispora epigaea]|uniref:P-loop containing nucleoside triphosphate hydrolase protein n=1 Tax=Diversispora epigaea TaxID=1348612 RepID=A0A397HCL2_9GLOM|nr:hypothetical protein Glove_350g174 [Diversispora epigaea]
MSKYGRKPRPRGSKAGQWSSEGLSDETVQNNNNYTYNNYNNNNSQQSRRGGGGNYNNSNNYRNNNNRNNRNNYKIRPTIPQLIELVKPSKNTGFRSIPVIPTHKEIISFPPPESIPINKIETPYSSIEEYLETHYKLLREDCIRPLREGIEDYIYPKEDVKAKDNVKDGVKDDSNKLIDPRRPSLRIYENINLVGVTYANVGVVHRISFRTQHGERIKWITSKRLIPGTLVIFTKDKFKTVKFATVVSRHESLLEKSWDLQIDVLFRPEDAEFVLPEGYIMVEATSSYFEAYRHVLNVLQEMNPETLPFQEHIINGNGKIEIPKYLEMRMQSNPKYDFEEIPAFPDLEKHLGTSHIDVTKDWNEWPHIDQMNTELHATQYEALKRIISRKLALIQGPPGTGKTYIGLAAVKILLKNTPGVIIIACQTNHALDQFLSGILEFEPEVVRLGSRSKSEKIKNLTLFSKFQSLRNSDTESAPYNPETGRLYKKRDTIMNKMTKLCREIEDPYISLDYVISNKILSEAQLQSLKQEDWVSSSSNNDSKDDDQKNIKDWLTESVSTHSAVHAEIEFNVSQAVDIEKKKDEEDEDEVDEEVLKEIQEEFQSVEGGKMVNGSFSELRGEQYINDDVYVNENDLNRYAKCKDLWEIPTNVRAVLHNRWRNERLEVICDELKQLFQEYQKLSNEIKREKIREDLAILKSARVVGMTTTAAAKYHELLINLKPKIMIVEEAAETLEAHIVTALTPYTEHLILIGDHQQLRPNVSVYDLAKNHNLDVSLFERLTKFLPLTQLTEQRRMRTEIRELLTPIYGDILTDHPRVNDYPKVQGIVDDLFFFDHTQEETTMANSMSKYNEFEAKICSKLASFLVKNGTNPQTITILSMYSGQRRKIEDLLRNESRSYPQIKSIRVSSVDGYQGEENEIIILSLVRSRDPRYGIGFLRVSNRVCVALSRAKHGLYIFGNEAQLSRQSDLWKIILRRMKKNSCLGQFIDLFCPKHSDIEKGFDGLALTQAWCYNDIPSIGGCTKKCGESLPCGHICDNECHFELHTRISCQAKCTSTLKCGHPCKNKCGEACGDCKVTIQLDPECGHSKEITCDIAFSSKYKCKERCSKKLECGHKCEKACSAPCTTNCDVDVKFKYPCGHINRVKCYQLETKKNEPCYFCKP